MTLSLFLLLLAGVALVVQTVALADQRRQRSVQRTMNGVITRQGQGMLEEMERLVREDRRVLGFYHQNAHRLAGRGRYHEALQRMELGCEAIEDLAPDFKSALRALRELARAVSGMVAVGPVRPSAFRTRSLSGLAGAGVVAHEFLLTGRQRILLRLRVVSAAFRLALRWLGRSTRRAAARPHRPVPWKTIDALVADLGTAGDEAVAATRQIVQALDAADLGSPAVHRVG